MGKKDWNCRIPKHVAFGISSVLWLFIFIVSIIKMIFAFQHNDVAGFLIVILMLVDIMICGGLLILYWRYYNLED